ncbi:MAG: YqaA family protein [Pseudomonadota bacterium]|nr:YqaA family protein [Pseudomonadota bacterium]
MTETDTLICNIAVEQAAKPSHPGWLRRLYDWTMHLACTRHALTALGVVSFVESSFFPVPPDALIIPMIISERRRAWIIASVCTAASVLGGILGYAIGLFAFEWLGRPIVEFYHLTDAFESFQARYAVWGAWIVAGAGFTPIPFKIFTIASGVARLDILVFVIAATLSRGARFFLEAWLLWHFGPSVKAFIERYLGLVTLAGFVLLIGGFAALKFL